MAETVRLLSVKGRAQLIEKFYFYDGEVAISDGIVEIPLDRPEWVQRAYIMGYRHDPVTEEALTLDEALTGIRVSFAPVEPESTESAGEEDDEGSDAGGQPVGEDGVRESEQPRSAGLLGRFLGRSSRDGATVAEGGDTASTDPV